MKIAALTLLAIDLTAFTPFAFAADPPSGTVEQRIDALQRELDALKKERTAKPQSTGATEAKLTLNNNRAAITSADGDSSLVFRVLLQGDTGFYDQDAAGPLSADFRRGSVGGTPNRENIAARDLSGGMYFRRARLGIEGAIARDFKYRLTFDFGGSGTEGPGRLIYGWIGYTGLAPFTFQLGAFSPPSNMENNTTPDDVLFIERASGAELSRSLGAALGRTAVGVQANGSRWVGSFALTGRTVNDAEVFDSQSALVGRGAFLVATSSDYNVHTGISGTYVLHPADAGADATGVRYGIRFRDRPELRVDSARLIDTGTIDADHAYVVGAELAGNWRNLYFQGEHFWYGVDRLTASDPRFSAYYVQGSWVMTGETHHYNMATAAYQAPRPSHPFGANGGIGAWELALRFSHTDLNYAEGDAGAAPTASSIRGGVQDIWTLGVNWYALANVRFTLDYYRVDVDRLNPAGPGNAAPFGAAPATPPIGAQIGQRYNALGLRSQFSF